jgi:hypothetical protein
VQCRGFPGKSLFSCFTKLGVTGKRRIACEEAAVKAERGSLWIWRRRMDVWKKA